MAQATEYTWDNFSGDSSFQTRINWDPWPDPANVPGSGDTATFDGLLAGSGVGINTVNVAHGTAIDVMKVIDTAVVDMTIGDGTTASRFDLDLGLGGDSLVIGDSFGDTATLNLKGGWLDTYQTRVGGRASFNVSGAGTIWDSTAVLISGDTITNTAGIGVGLSAQVDSSGTSVGVGSDTGSGRIVVDGTPQVLFGPSAVWGGIGALDVGPTGTSGFNFGSVTLQAGGEMSANTASVHGTTDVASKITVKTGGDLTVGGLLQIGPHGTLELFDSFSSITVGDIDNNGGSLNWTGGTLHITDGRLRIDDAAFADLDIANITVGSGMTLKVTQVAGHSLAIGNIGTGSMTIQNGGVVESYIGDVGESTGAHGTVNVNAARWTVTEELWIGWGNNAVGQINITNAGEVGARNIYLGNSGTASGTVTIDAGNLIADVGLYVAGNESSVGGTGSLTANGGGRVEVGSTLKVWGAGTVTINGPSVVVADQVNLSAGAVFNANAGSALYTNRLVGFGNHPAIGGNLLFGQAQGSSSATHSVGAGQSLDVGNNLVIGVDKAATLSVTGGGYVESHKGLIGGAAGSVDSAVSLSGAGSMWRIFDTLNVGGDGVSAGSPSTLSIQNGAIADADSTITVWPNSTITLNMGTLDGTSLNLSGGRLRGYGAVQLGGGTLQNAGEVEPGLSTGVIDVEGSYQQTANGGLDIQLASGTGIPGVSFDQLNLSGSASLGGELTLSLLGGYTPAIGDAFQIVHTAFGVSGKFSRVYFPNPGLYGLRMDYTDLYSVYVRAALAGDLNGDGFVRIEDLNIVLGNWNQNVAAGVWIEGDPSGDNFVGIEDLNAVLGNWNAGTPPGAPGANTNIPEPGALGVLGVLLGTGLLRRKRGC